MRRLYTLLVTVGLLAGISVASAHTTSIGYVPGTTAGSVTFWTGSYSHGSTPVNEGTATLTGVSVVYSQSVNFNIPPVGTKPTGLVDGVNNLYWCTDTTFPCNGPDPGVGGGVVWWQGVTFTGLTPGTYTFTCGSTCGVTQQWASFGTGTVTLTLTGSQIGGGVTPSAPIPTVSEWGLIVSAMMLLAMGLFALRLRRR